MKIAILCFGRIKNYDIHYENIMKNLGKNNELDFFLSHDPDLNEDLSGFIKLYNPISICDDEIKEEINFNKYSNLRPEVKYKNMSRHFFNKKRVFELLDEHIKKTNIVYDFIAYHRLDVFYYQELIYDMFLKNRDDKIHIPFVPEMAENGGDYMDKCVNDQFAIGNYQAIKTYANLFNNVERIIGLGCVPHPEQLLKHYLEDQGMNMIRFNLRYRIIR